MDWALALLGAVAVGALGNLAYELARNGGVRVPRLVQGRGRHLSDPVRNHDVSADGLIALNTWSRTRPLTPSRLETSYRDLDARTHLFDDPEWQQRVAEHRAQGDDGRTCYIAALDIDHEENEHARRCRVTLAESRYAETTATHALVKEQPARKNALRAALDGGLDEFLRVVPPTSLSFTVVVVSRRNRLLVLRRSRSVRTYPNTWCIGINETMKYATEPGAREDFYGLIERGLHEELGISPADYASPFISWLGWSSDASCFHGVAMTRLQVTEAVVDQRRGESHSVYEHDSAAWLQLDRRTITQLIGKRDAPDGTSDWSYLTPMVALELWRCRGAF